MSPASLDRIEREIAAYEALLTAVHALPSARRAGNEVVAIARAQAALESWRTTS